MVLGAARGNADSESDERQTRYNGNRFRVSLQTIINTFCVLIYTYHILYHKYTSKLLSLLRRLSSCLEMFVFVITLY